MRDFISKFAEKGFETIGLFKNIRKQIRSVESQYGKELTTKSKIKIASILTAYYIRGGG